jgi:hypothetical protein
MADFRIFSYLPSPRVSKAIAARLCGVTLEFRGAPAADLPGWLWDYDARALILRRGRRRDAGVQGSALRQPGFHLDTRSTARDGLGEQNFSCFSRDSRLRGAWFESRTSSALSELFGDPVQLFDATNMVSDIRKAANAAQKNEESKCTAEVSMGVVSEHD